VRKRRTVRAVRPVQVRLEQAAQRHFKNGRRLRNGGFSCQFPVAGSRFPIPTLVAGNWKLETGNWKLETGNWELLPVNPASAKIGA
jgi:hypothetical protein